MEPAITAVKDVETMAQRPSLVARAARAPRSVEYSDEIVVWLRRSTSAPDIKSQHVPALTQPYNCARRTGDGAHIARVIVGASTLYDLLRISRSSGNLS